MDNNVFEQIAKRYDSEKTKALAKVIVKEVRQHISNGKLKTLIDYGSGTGLIGLGLADLVDSVLLVDSSEQMLAVAKEKIAQRKMINAKVMCADFTKEPSEMKADIILMSLVLLHIPDTKLILSALYDALNVGGKLVIVDFDENDQVSHPKIHSGFSHEGLKEVLSEIGFKSIEFKTFYHGKQVFMNKDASMFIADCVK